MLLFFRDEEAFYDPGDDGAVRIEWYDLGIPRLVTRRKCPKPSFPVPKFHGVLCRMNEYPESGDLFEQAGHYQSYLFGTTQASRIGRRDVLHPERPTGGGRICSSAR